MKNTIALIAVAMLGLGCGNDKNTRTCTGTVLGKRVGLNVTDSENGTTSTCFVGRRLGTRHYPAPAYDGDNGFCVVVNGTSKTYFWLNRDRGQCLVIFDDDTSVDDGYGAWLDEVP